MRSRLVITIAFILICIAGYSMERTNKARPVTSEVTQCWSTVEDCTPGDFLITYGTVRLQVSAVGNGVLVRDMLGDTHWTDRKIWLLANPAGKPVLLASAQVIVPSGHDHLHYNTAEVDIEENGYTTSCLILKADGNRSAGVMVGCNH